MKKELYTPFGDTYTLKEAKADSDRSLIPARKRIIDRLLAKLHAANEKYHGQVVRCLLASACVIALSVNSFA
jgi:hypothetical protein